MPDLPSDLLAKLPVEQSDADIDFDHPPEDPFQWFATWFVQAQRSEVNDPNAMSLATVDADGCPNVRTVLLKGVDHGGFVFYTNLTSAKGQELQSARYAALNFHWKSVRRQVRIRGAVAQVTDAEADDYFATRPRQSQLGAWASQQSHPISGRVALEAALADTTAQYDAGPVPRPPHWSGFRVVPTQIEFWQDGAYRLHDRIQFQRVEQGWTRTQLFP